MPSRFGCKLLDERRPAFRHSVRSTGTISASGQPYGDVPDRLGGRRVPEIENQVQAIAHDDGNAGGAQKIRQIEDVRQVRDDEAIEFGRYEAPVEAWHGEPRGCREEQGAREDSRPPASGGSYEWRRETAPAPEELPALGSSTCDDTYVGAIVQLVPLRSARPGQTLRRGRQADLRAPPGTRRWPARMTGHRRQPRSRRERAKFRRRSARGPDRASRARAQLVEAQRLAELAAAVMNLGEPANGRQIFRRAFEHVIRARSPPRRGR